MSTPFIFTLLALVFLAVPGIEAVGKPSASAHLAGEMTGLGEKDEQRATLSSWTAPEHEARCESQAPVLPCIALRNLKHTKTALHKAVLRESALLQALFSMQKRTFELVRLKPVLALTFTWFHHFP